MKVAVPVFQTRVSPRFDVAQGAILLDVENGKVKKITTLLMMEWTSREKVKKLHDLNVETVICGGIDTSSKRLFEECGINVYSWIAGEVEDAVVCFMNDGLISGDILGLGWQANDKKCPKQWQHVPRRNGAPAQGRHTRSGKDIDGHNGKGIPAGQGAFWGRGGAGYRCQARGHRHRIMPFANDNISPENRKTLLQNQLNALKRKMDDLVNQTGNADSNE